MLPRDPRGSVDPWDSRRLSRRAAADPRSSRDGPRAGYYDATNRSPARTAAIYFFSLTALVIGGVLIFLLFRVLSDDGGEVEPTPTPVPVTAVSIIESPIPGARHPVNEPLDVIASVVSGEGVERITLFVSGIVSDEEFSPPATGDGTRYAAVLTARFDAVGGYELVVRAITDTGKIVMSEPVRVVAEPAATVTPETSPTATIVVVTSLRTGPGQDYNQAGTLEPGDVVTVTGKTADLQWLRVERGGGLWVRFNAIDVSPADLERVPNVEATAPPAATPTRPPQTQGGDTSTDTDEEPDTPEETPTATATVPPNAPDFIPSNAVLLEGGSILRITLTNTSTNPFSGAIVVRVEETPGGAVEQVLTVAMDPNGEAWVNFEIDPPIDEQVNVTVTVDPDDAIAEPNEDNNTTTFVVVPPPEGPILSLQATVTNGALTVTILNEGTELTTNDARLVVSVPGETTTRTVSPLAIPENESASISGIAAPRTGEAITITLLIDGVSIAAVSVPNPNVVEVPTETPTPTPDAEATQDPSEPTEPSEPEEPEEPEESGGG